MVDYYNKRLQELGVSTLQRELAVSLNSRGAILRNLGIVDKAVLDLDKATKIQRRLLNTHGVPNPLTDLAKTLSDRGVGVENLFAFRPVHRHVRVEKRQKFHRSIRAANQRSTC